jgi:hypothetical protein
LAGSSGTYNYSLSNAEAVLAAFERVQIRTPELRQEHFITARRELNDLFVELANREVNLWKVTRPEDGNTVTMVQGTLTYTLPANVVMILDAYISLNFGTTNQTDTYVTPLSRTQYASLADKYVQGRPTQYWMDRTITPTITMWPVPDGGGPYTFGYYACIQLQDANLPSGETPDMPYRWLGVLIAGLALRLARVYKPELLADRKADYAEAWNWAAEQDTENVNTSYTPLLADYYR